MGNQKSRVQVSVAPTPVMSVVKQIELLEKRRSQKEALIRTCVQEAKRLITVQDTPGALHQLKEKRHHETELTKIYVMMDKLCELQHATESAKITSSVLRVTEAGASAIKSIGLDVDKADAIMDASRDAIDTVNDVIGVFGHSEVDSDIEKELREMSVDLPVIPTHIPALSSNDEIAQLERQALPA